MQPEITPPLETAAWARGPSTAVTEATRKTRPFSVSEPRERDERVSDRIWEIPRRIEQVNRENGLNYSQFQLSKVSGVSQSLLSHLSTYQNLFGIRVDTVERLSAALNTSLGRLLGEASGSDTMTLARAAAGMLTELDGIGPDEAWLLMRDIEATPDTVDGYYVAAKRLLASRVGLTADDLAAHKVKASKILDGSAPLGRRKAR